MKIDKPTFQELGTLLRVVGTYMEATGVMPGVVVGEYRDHMGDEVLIEQMEDAGITPDRATELLGLSLEEIARIDC